jgi:hypothetical protein
MEVLMKIIGFTFGAFLLLTIFAPSALGQQTFVASTGVDTNPCSRTAPCRTFQAAVNAAPAGGVVIALDSAGFGSNVTVNKAIEIIAPAGVFAAITVFSGDGIDISAGTGIVLLRGVTVNNQGSTGNGIVDTSAAVVHVESCNVNGFSNGATSGTGLAVKGHGDVEVKDSIFRGNDQGISVQPSSGTALVVIDHCRLEASPSHNGLIAQDGATVTVRNTIAAANTQNGFEVAADSRPAELNIENCISSNNTLNGIDAIALGTAAAIARVSDSTITDNAGTGLLNDGSPAQLLSRGNNTVEGNGSPTAGTIGSFAAR